MAQLPEMYRLRIAARSCSGPPIRLYSRTAEPVKQSPKASITSKISYQLLAQVRHRGGFAPFVGPCFSPARFVFNKVPI